MELDRIKMIEGFIDKLIKDKTKVLYPNGMVPAIRYIEDEDLKMLIELRDYTELIKGICKDMTNMLEKHKKGR